MRKIRVAVLGSTGSIGRQTLEVIDVHRDRFEVVALTAGRNTKELAEQIRKYKPKYAYAADLEELRKLTPHIELKSHEEIVCSEDVDVVVVGIPGFDSVKPVIDAVKSGKKVAVASKEAILCGGELIFSVAKTTGAKILPVDSEHSSLWKILERYGRRNIKRIYITASGGPFFDLPKEMLENVTVEDTLKHPVWSMGKKITVDSASLMNKAFEIIEASYLFEIPPQMMAVKIHPEAIVHSAVEYKDGTIIMSAHFPDMKIPITYSLLHEEDFEIPFEIPDVWSKPLRFLDPDESKFPAISMGWRCARYPLPCVLVAADDVAVDLFLQNKIKFTDIYRIVDQAVSHFEKSVWDRHIKSFEDVLKLSDEVKKVTSEIAKNFIRDSNGS